MKFNRPDLAGKALLVAAMSLFAAGLAHGAEPRAPNLKIRDGVVVAPSTSGAPQDADCLLEAVQGGLVACTGPVGARVYKNAELVSFIDDTGLAAIGLKTDEKPGLRISIDTDDGVLRDFDIAVASREDPVRYVSGLDCDKVDARTPEQKAHAASSWEIKQAAFGRYESPQVSALSFEAPAVAPFSSPFGPRRVYSGKSKVTGQSCSSTSVHRGLDMATPTGTPLLAPLGGTVTLADPDLYYEGGAIFLDHGWGLVSVFMHLSEVDVDAGQVVETGERLGATGNTGRTTGPHLHWAVKWRPLERSAGSGFYIDPAILLKLTKVQGVEREQDPTD